ncbi:MAG: hypothetical protein U5R31_08330 [Acidimicrobiia bacterium]|nr:hypothetical protein [Acidimicrobiia bacterium]
MLAAVTEYIREGELELDLALQMARVIGSSLARIATAQVEAAQVRRGQAGADRSDPREQAQEVQRSAELVPMPRRRCRHRLATAPRRGGRPDGPGREQRGAPGRHRRFRRPRGLHRPGTAAAGGRAGRCCPTGSRRWPTTWSCSTWMSSRPSATRAMFRAEDVTQGAEIAAALAEGDAADEASTCASA